MLHRRTLAAASRLAKAANKPQHAHRATFSTAQCLKAQAEVEDPEMVGYTCWVPPAHSRLLEWWLHQPSRDQTISSRPLRRLDTSTAETQFWRTCPRRQRCPGHILSRRLHSHDTCSRCPHVGRIYFDCPRAQLCRQVDVSRPTQRSKGIRGWVRGRARWTRSSTSK